MSERVLLLGAGGLVGIALCPCGSRRRCSLAFAAAGAFAHWGWCLHYLPLAMGDPSLWLDPRAGYAASFAPLGALVLPARERSVAIGWLASLPLVLALARLGCPSAGCCAPTALAESVASALVFLALLPLPGGLRAGLGLAGLALIRLLAEPFREIPPLGAPWLSPVWPPGVALGVGAWLALRCLSVPRGRRCPANNGSRKVCRSVSS